MQIPAHRIMGNLSQIGLNILLAIALLDSPSRASEAVVAAPLADHVPADAIVYAGWRGADGLDQSYAGTHLAGMGISILFADGHVEFFPMPEARERIDRANGSK